MVQHMVLFVMYWYSKILDPVDSGAIKLVNVLDAFKAIARTDKILLSIKHASKKIQNHIRRCLYGYGRFTIT